MAELDDITTERDNFRQAFENLRKQRLNEFMAGFNVITNKLKENYQMLTLGGDAELELVDSLDPFSEGIVFRLVKRSSVTAVIVIVLFLFQPARSVTVFVSSKSSLLPLTCFPAPPIAIVRKLVTNFSFVSVFGLRRKAGRRYLTYQEGRRPSVHWLWFLLFITTSQRHFILWMRSMRRLTSKMCQLWHFTFT